MRKEIRVKLSGSISPCAQKDTDEMKSEGTFRSPLKDVHDVKGILNF